MDLAKGRRYCPETAERGRAIQRLERTKNHADRNRLALRFEWVQGGGMMTLNRQRDVDAGSRMHLLDWLESANFLPELRGFVAPIDFAIADDAEHRPKGRHDHRESALVGRNEPFLTPDQQDTLAGWWVQHRAGAKLPTWDLVVSARDASDRHALILVEAKAYTTELSAAGKPTPRRETPEQQERSEENHSQIARAIAEANAALQDAVPGITINLDTSYQFANRIAFAWKLASLGVPVALI